MEEKTSDTIIDELFTSLDLQVPSVPESDNTPVHSMAESIKKRKRHDKSKKHKKHKKKSKKSKKRKHRSRSDSSDDRIELKLKVDKLEEVKSGLPVTLDVVMETIVTTANEKSEKVKNVSYDENCNDKTVTHESTDGQTPENDVTSNVYINLIRQD